MKRNLTGVEIAVLQEQMMINSKEHREIKECITSLEGKIDKMLGEKANKWVESFAYFLITAIVGGFIYTLFRLIEK